jgi:hypothetical protein
VEAVEPGSTVDGTSRLVEEARVSVPREDVRFDERTRGVPFLVGGLALPPPCLVALASFIGPHSLAVQVLMSGCQPGAVGVVIGLIASAARRLPMQNLGDGRLADSQLRRDLSLGVAGGHEVPGLLGAYNDHVGRLMTTYATPPAGALRSPGHPAA